MDFEWVLQEIQFFSLHEAQHDLFAFLQQSHLRHQKLSYLTIICSLKYKLFNNKIKS